MSRSTLNSVDSGRILVLYIKNSDHLVDIMTHVIPSRSFYITLSTLIMCDISAPILRGEPVCPTGIIFCIIILPF